LGGLLIVRLVVVVVVAYWSFSKNCLAGFSTGYPQGFLRLSTGPVIFGLVGCSKVSEGLKVSEESVFVAWRCTTNCGKI